MDDRSMQFALFLAIAVIVPVLVAVGIDIARRIIAAMHHRIPLATTTRDHELR